MCRPLRPLILGVIIGVAFCPHPIVAEGSTTVAAFSGADGGPNGNAFYLGAIAAVNGDLARDGVLVRALGVYGTYDYRATIGDVWGTYWLFDEMVGYQIIRPGIRVAAYVGAEQQQHDLTPSDPTNRVQGAATGFKVAGDVTLGHNQPLFLNLAGSYSTAFDTYWSRLRIGYKIDRFTFGPEGLLTGNESSDARRVGGFMQMRLDNAPIEITLSAGQHTNDKNGIFANKDGTYAQLNLGVSY